MLTQGIEIGAGWTRKGETSGKDYVSLSIAAPEFGPKKLYANLGKAIAASVGIFAIIRIEAISRCFTSLMSVES